MPQSRQRDLCHPENPKSPVLSLLVCKGHIISIEVQLSSAGPGLIAYVVDIKELVVVPTPSPEEHPRLLATIMMRLHSR